MKCDAASQKHTRELTQRAVELNGHAACCFAKRAEFCLIVRVVVEDSQALHDERC